MNGEGEWGPWIKHRGDGCPIEVGTWVRVDVGINTIRGYGHFAEFRVRQPFVKWVGWRYVIRYRIRKPRGLTILESLLENLPEEVDA